MSTLLDLAPPVTGPREHLENVVKLWPEHRTIGLQAIPDSILESMVREAFKKDHALIASLRHDLTVARKQTGELLKHEHQHSDAS